MRKMKDSGIEWIGEIPESWDTIKLNYLFKTIGSGTTPNTGNGMFYDGKYNWLQTGDLTDGIVSTTSKTITQEAVDTCSALTLFKKGAVVIAMYGATIGKLGILDIDCYTNQACCALSEPIDTDSKFVYYWLLCNKENIVRLSLGGGQPNISQGIITSLKVSIPASVTEQSRIAEYLDQKCAEIDAIIAAKEKTNELLKERRQSIIYEAVTKGLDPTVPMKDSGIEWIGIIPESWDVCPVKYVIDKNHPYPVGDGDHGLIKADDYLDEGIPYIRVLNLTWGEGLNLENLVYISDEMNSRIKNSELKPNDILIAKTGATIGKTAIVPVSLPRSNTTSHVGKITISSDHNAVFFYYVMTSSIVQKQIQDLSAMQSTRPELGIDGLRNLLVVVPPVEEQQDISEFLNQQCAEINSVIDTNKSMIDKLKEYRQSVIYEAVTGKVEI